MIAVTCSACRLRFEAPATERRLQGADIVCPACDAGEPIVLDVTASGRGKTGRLQLTPPPFDMAAEAPSASTMAQGEAVAQLNAIRGPAVAMPIVGTDPSIDAAFGSEPMAIEAPTYVDFDLPADGTARETPLLTQALQTSAAVAAVVLIAFAVTWPSQTSLVDEVRTLATAFGGKTDDTQAIGTQAKNPARIGDEALITAGIRKIAPDRLDASARVPATVRIARVSTELADTDSGRVLTVRTDIRNDGDAAVEAPTLRVSIRSNDGTVLHRWTQANPNAAIDAGETRAFAATTRRIPEGAGDVKVDFASR